MNSRYFKPTNSEPLSLFHNRFMSFVQKPYKVPKIGINRYQWGSSRISASKNRVYIYYRSLKITGGNETIEIKTGSHILIDNHDLGFKFLHLINGFEGPLK